MRARFRLLSTALLLLAAAGCQTAPVSAPPAPPPPPPEPVVREITPQIQCAAATFHQEGIATYYGASHQGKKTANGERFDMNTLVAAHRTLPFDTRIRVTNLENGRSIDVRINDRGPYVRNRILDLSRRAANELGFVRDGMARVRIETLGPGC